MYWESGWITHRNSLWTWNLLPQHYNPLFNNEKFLEVSGDRLVIAIEARDSKYDAVATRQFLEEIGGTDIEEVSA